MSCYHQMGDKSANLLFEPELKGYAGAILSPVNYDLSQIMALLKRVRKERPDMEMIFDPQIYFPRSDRGKIATWAHFPNDVDTADLSQFSWWANSVDALVNIINEVGPNAVCSPAIVPRVFSDEFYSLMVDVGDDLTEKSPLISVLQTVVIGLDDVSVPARAHEIASIISRAKSERVFLVISSDIIPRREIVDPECLKGVMRLINLLEAGGQQVLVGFCSTDMVLWKAAGATSCATGKFFNLRRFTRSRFEEPLEGGRQLPYWCEEALLAYLRESDVVRVQQAGGFSDASNRNPITPIILKAMNSPEPWLGHSWKHFLWWFSDLESRATPTHVIDVLKRADDLWKHYEINGPLMEERQNDGSWVRQWRRAVMEFSAH